MQVWTYRLAMARTLAPVIQTRGMWGPCQVWNTSLGPRRGIAMQGFGLIIEDLGEGAVRIALHGELDLAHAYTFDDELLRVEAGAPQCIVLDLRALTFLDSCGL